MERITASVPKADHCAICGVMKEAGETWFLVTENRWDDRLDVWKWHSPQVLEASVHSLCSPRHVREMVVHWMTTGCLAYPFASMPEERTHDPSRPALAGGSQLSVHPMLQHLGELSVDRIGLLRVLRENPLSLNVVLDELMIALEPETGNGAESEFEDGLCFALPTA